MIGDIGLRSLIGIVLNGGIERVVGVRVGENVFGWLASWGGGDL